MWPGCLPGMEEWENILVSCTDFPPFSSSAFTSEDLQKAIKDEEKLQLM